MGANTGKKISNVITIENMVIPKEIMVREIVSDSGCLNLIKNTATERINIANGTKSLPCIVTK